MKTKLLLAAVAVSILGLASQAQAANVSHVDKLASAAEVQTKQIKWYTQHYLLNQRNSKHLLHDLVKLQKLSKHIHDLVHQLENGRPVLGHLRSDVAKMDSLVHHLDRLLVAMKSDLNRKLRSLSGQRNNRCNQVRIRNHNGSSRKNHSSFQNKGRNHNARAIATIRYQLTVLKKIDRMTHKLENIVQDMQHDLRHVARNERFNLK